MQITSKYSIVLISLLILTLILPNINAYIINSVETNKIEIQFKPDIIIPDDYKTIQDGINNADSEEMIFVRSGVYFENIIVDRKIKIYGENKKNTIINGILNKKSTITIVSPNVVITNFLIINGISSKNSWDNSGVYIKKSNVTIKDNLIMHNTLGICALDVAHNLTINNNQFIEDGILLANYEYTKNSFTFESTLHTIKNNTVNGKPLYYFKNKNNFTVNNDAGQVILVNCSNVTIKNTFFTKCDFPVLLYFCDNCVIENITSKDTYGEIILFNSTNCIIQYNNASDMIFGVCLDYESTNNVVRHNNVYNNIAGITVMTSSKNNKVYKNKIHDNTEGIRISNKSSGNCFYKNKLSNNVFGFSIILDAYENYIENNTIIKNLLFVRSAGKIKNYYNNNYWNRPRLFPKIIFGCLTLRKVIPTFLIPYTISGIDWNPAKKPTI